MHLPNAGTPEAGANVTATFPASANGKTSTLRTISTDAGEPDGAVPVANGCSSPGAAQGDVTASAIPITDGGQAAGIKRTGNGAASGTYTGKRVDLWPVNRKSASQTFFQPPLWLAPENAEIVAIGAHDFLEIYLAAWVSDRGYVVVGIEAPLAEAGRPFLLRLSTEQRDYPSIEAILEPYDTHRAVGIVATLCSYRQGIRVAGLALVSRILDGEEQ